jgi:hypothetical protein
MRIRKFFLIFLFVAKDEMMITNHFLHQFSHGSREGYEDRQILRHLQFIRELRIFVRTRVFHARPNKLSRAFLTMNLRWARGSSFSSSAPHFCSAMVAMVATVDIFSTL